MQSRLHSGRTYNDYNKLQWQKPIRNTPPDLGRRTGEFKPSKKNINDDIVRRILVVLPK